MVQITRQTKRHLLLTSMFFGALSILAYFSPNQLCPYFVHIPWLASTCPYITDDTPFQKPWGSVNVKTTSTTNVELSTLPRMTPLELQLHNGDNPKEYPLRLAIDGIVVDVDTVEGNRFYAVGQNYHVFAGGDYTRALALGSLDQKDISLKAFVDDFTTPQRKELLDRVQFYVDKYVPVAVLKGSERGNRYDVK
jgi:hypothetical protein